MQNAEDIFWHAKGSWEIIHQLSPNCKFVCEPPRHPCQAGNDPRSWRRLEITGMWVSIRESLSSYGKANKTHKTEMSSFVGSVAIVWRLKQCFPMCSCWIISSPHGYKHPLFKTDSGQNLHLVQKKELHNSEVFLNVYTFVFEWLSNAEYLGQEDT